MVWNDQWLTALAGQASAPADAVFMGNSNAEGMGASTKANRWLDLLLTEIRTLYSVSGGAGYIPTYYAVSGASTWQSYSAQTGPPTESTTIGTFGYRTISLTSGQSRTYPVTGTSVDIWWVSNTTGGTFSYAVDGGSATNVSTVGTYHTNNKTRVTFGAGGSHTIVIAGVSGTSQVGGFTVFNSDETSGIRFYDASHSGFTSGNTLTDGGEMGVALGSVVPDLVIIELGGNDCIQGLGTAQFATNLGFLVDGALGMSPIPSILLIAPPNAAPSVMPAATWATYIDVMEAEAAQHPDNVALLDLTQYFTIPDLSGTGLFRTDGTHLNDSGQIQEKNLVRDKILEVPATPNITGSFTGRLGTGNSRLGIFLMPGYDSLAGGAGTVTQTDSAGLTDTAAVDQQKALTDSAGLTDTAPLTRSLVFADDAGLTDAAPATRSLVYTDSAGLTDTAAAAAASPVRSFIMAPQRR